MCIRLMLIRIITSKMMIFIMGVNRLKTGICYTDFIKRMIIGLIIGIACITPGISAGAIAAAAGLYEPVIYAIVRITKQFIKSVIYLFPFDVGAGIGILLFSTVILCFDNYKSY